MNLTNHMTDEQIKKLKREHDDLRCALLGMLYAFDYKEGDYPGLDLPSNLVGNEWRKAAALNARAVLREIK